MLRLGVITDVHSDARAGAAWHNRYDPAGTLERMRSALELFEAMEVDALAVLGDVTDSGRPQAFAPAVDLLAGWPRPLVVVPGNHDAQEPGVFAAAAGRLGPPRALALPGAGLRTVDLVGRWPGRLEPRLAPGNPGGAVEIVAGHYPVLSQAPAAAAAGLKYAGDLAARQRLEAAVRALAVPTVVLCGHLHVRAAETSGALLHLAFASLIEYPFEVGVVEVQPGRVARRCMSMAPHPPGHEADPVLAPADQEWAFQEGGWHVLAD